MTVFEKIEAQAETEAATFLVYSWFRAKREAEGK